MSESLRELAIVEYGASPKEIRVKNETQIKIFGTGGLVGYSRIPLFEEPLIVVARKGTLDKPIFSENPCWVIDTAFAVIPKKDVDAKWLYYQLSNYDLKKLNEATGVPSINRDFLYRIKFKKQPLPTQRKIARILSTADAVIEKTEAAISKYKAIKQGMLHDLFTRGIDPATNKLRRTYEDAPELYKESKLGWVPKEWEATSILTSTYIKGRIGWQGLRADEFIETGPFLITGTDFINGKISWNTCYHISEKRFNEAPPIQIKDNDVLITKDGTIGKIALVTDCPEKAILNSGIFVLRCKDNNYLNQYLFYLLSSELFCSWLAIYQGGSTINHLYQREFERFLFPIPKLEEQTEIINRLKTIDTKIQTEQTYLHKLQQIKAGLMADLLSGKKKVNVCEELKN